MAIRLQPIPMMDPLEIQAMRNILDERKPCRVLEWGSGGSTIYWPRRYPTIKWVSIEHNPEYARALKGKVSHNVTVMRLDFPDYHELTPDQVGIFDLIIVDGRKRVRCLDIGRDLLAHDGAVLLHDAGRERYVQACQYYSHITVLHPPKKSKDPRGLWLLENPRPTKIFGIGLSRTGTNSLNMALCKLGYKAFHYPSPNRIMAFAAKYDALTDTPVIRCMERLDQRYPGALFIYTTRDIDSWLKSCEAYWRNANPTGMNNWNRVNVYGRPDFDEATFREVYCKHYERVRQYFASRPWKLLEMDIFAGDGYEKLCPALGLPVLAEPFPHESAAPETESQ